MKSFLLMVDSGNTNVKWGLYDGDGQKWLKRGVVPQDDTISLERVWKGLQEPSRIIVSNVANAQAKENLSQSFSSWSTEPCWISACAYQCGVRNYYEDASQLGSDRWAALIAAWQQQRQGCLVVDAGTATTIDALSDTGEFLGGIITPGIDLMQKSLTENTGALKPEGGKFRDYPDRTADAIYSGAVQAIAGAVERMAALLSSTIGREPECILSGGAARQLQPHLNVSTTIVDNLVLEGLAVISQEILETLP